jgi:hypothetical protein
MLYMLIHKLSLVGLHIKQASFQVQFSIHCMRSSCILFRGCSLDTIIFASCSVPGFYTKLYFTTGSGPSCSSVCWNRLPPLAPNQFHIRNLKHVNARAAHSPTLFDRFLGCLTKPPQMKSLSCVNEVEI